MGVVIEMRLLLKISRNLSASISANATLPALRGAVLKTKEE
jgi:hypothetical protein